MLAFNGLEPAAGGRSPQEGKESSHQVIFLEAYMTDDVRDTFLTSGS